MHRMVLSLSAAIVGTLGLASAARGVEPVESMFPPPLQCVESISLRVQVEGSEGLAGDLVPDGVLEQRILTGATKLLAEAGVTNDPEAREIHLILSIGSTGEPTLSLAPEKDADWAIAHEVQVGEEGEPATARDVERDALDLLADALGHSEDCRPTRVSSADDRFELELPPDPPIARARYLRERLGPDASNEAKGVQWGFLFEHPEQGAEELRTTVQLPAGTSARQVHLSYDGRFVAVVAMDSGNWGLRRNSLRVTLVSVEDGESRSLEAADLLTSEDADSFRFSAGPRTEASLNDETSQLVLSVPIGGTAREIEVDLATVIQN